MSFECRLIFLKHPVLHVLQTFVDKRTLTILFKKKKGFLTLAPLGNLGPGMSVVGSGEEQRGLGRRCCPVHCRTFSSIPGFCLLDAKATVPVVTIKNTATCFLWAGSLPGCDVLPERAGLHSAAVVKRHCTNAEPV